MMNTKLKKALDKTKKEHEVVYAGLVGSKCAVKDRNTDWDVIVCTTATPPRPELIHDENINQLVLSENWLGYETHEEYPTGLIPSILFESIEFSKPLLGKKPKTDRIIVQEIDFLNCGIKMERFKHINRKERLVARIIYELLKQNRIEEYCF